MMKHKGAHNVLNSLILAFKVFSLLTLTTIFLYWSTTAIVKFKSLPTSSTVAYRFGDDGHGNIDFPAISICLETDFFFTSLQGILNGIKYKCRPGYVENFAESLEFCTASTPEEIGSPIKIILKLNGDIKAVHNGLEGIYIMNRFDLLNGKPYWEHREYHNIKIWFGGNGTTWNIGTYHAFENSYSYETAIYSLENAVGPLETTSWAYNNGNGSEFISSTDLTLQSGKKEGIQYLEYFKKIEDLLNVIKMIEITDILHEFKFGFEKSQRYPIEITRINNGTRNEGNYQGGKEILDWLKYFWKPSLHFERGICYTFDGVAIILNPRGKGIIATMAKEAMSKAMYKGSMLTLELIFDISKMAEKLNLANIPKYLNYVEVFIHNGKESLNNTIYDTEPIVINTGMSKKVKITKSNLNSISTIEDPCANDDTLTRADAAIKKADYEIERKFNCNLPWISDERYGTCPIIDQNRNETYSTMIGIWTLEYDRSIQFNSIPKCWRSMIKQTLAKETEFMNNESKLEIQLENPNVLTIVDSYTYDIQSFVGEVGGTLGLFLGLSIFSFVEFIEYILRKIYSERPERILNLF